MIEPADNDVGSCHLQLIQSVLTFFFKKNNKIASYLMIVGQWDIYI